jgi:hypothetical protein
MQQVLEVCDHRRLVEDVSIRLESHQKIDVGVLSVTAPLELDAVPAVLPATASSRISPNP